MSPGASSINFAICNPDKESAHQNKLSDKVHPMFILTRLLMALYNSLIISKKYADSSLDDPKDIS